MEWLQGLGLLGLFLGTFMAATMVPFNSTVLYIGILLTGVNPWIVFLVGTLGNWSGGLTTYGVGRLGKWEWIEKWFKVKPETLIEQKAKIDRWGSLLALVTWLPFVGDVFAIALGFYIRQRPRKREVVRHTGGYIQGDLSATDRFPGKKIPLSFREAPAHQSHRTQN
jgi:membrane protein YqaA with SNARE-associated domain